jgi:hypothetical protein
MIANHNVAMGTSGGGSAVQVDSDATAERMRKHGAQYGA